MKRWLGLCKSKLKSFLGYDLSILRFITHMLLKEDDFELKF